MTAQATDTEAKGLCVYCGQMLPRIRGDISTVDLSDTRELSECQARCPTADWALCSREPGHGGNHIACGLQFHAIERWGKTAQAKEKRTRWLLLGLLTGCCLWAGEAEAGECKRIKQHDIIVTIGDSNTSGEVVLPEERWPRLLGEALRAEVRNVAVFGTQSKHWLPWGALWGAFVGPNIPATDAVVIMLGTNDAFVGVPLQTYLFNMLALVDSIDGPDVYLVTPPPGTPPLRLLAYSLWLLRLRLPNVCGVLVSAGAVSIPFDYIEDGRHLNAQGHRNLADAIAEALQ